MAGLPSRDFPKVFLLNLTILFLQLIILGLDGDDQFDENLIHSPKVVVGKDAFRPQNYQEKAALNRGWLDSSRYEFLFVHYNAVLILILKETKRNVTFIFNVTLLI